MRGRKPKGVKVGLEDRVRSTDYGEDNKGGWGLEYGGRKVKGAKVGPEDRVRSTDYGKIAV